MRRRFLALSVTALGILVIVLFLKISPQLKAAIGHVTLGGALALMMVQLIQFGVNGIVLRDFTECFGVRLIFREWLGLSVTSALGNYLTPFSGGLVFRAVYLKRRHALTYSSMLAFLASNYIVTFGAAGWMGLGLTLVTHRVGSAMNWMTLIFGAAGIGSLIPVFFPWFRLPGTHRAVRSVNKILESFFKLRQDPRLLRRLMGLNVAGILLFGFSYWLAFRALGHPAGYGQALLIGIVAVFAVVINVTPGNLGVQETAVFLSSKLMGLDPGVGVLAALLIRAATLFWILVLGPVFSILLTRRMVLGKEIPGKRPGTQENQDRS